MRPLVVQQSFPAPRPTSNPYTSLLLESLRTRDGVEVRVFSWRSALLHRADVFHAHWPEILVSGGSPVRTAARQALFLLLLVRLRAGRTAIVRTAHNLELPTGLTRRQRRLLLLLDRLVDLQISLNEDTPAPPGRPNEIIPHGHYRDWFRRHPEPEPVPGRFGYFGLIRRYKNVVGLVRAFAPLEGGVSLEIAGKPSSAELTSEIEAATGGDARISLRFEFLTDEDLVRTAGRAELIVLPYEHMHNSGGVLAALSLNRPVLVPRSATNERLAAEVGPGWVLQYPDELRSDDLRQALATHRVARDAERPDLSARGWDVSAARHEEAYSRAVRTRAARSRGM